MLFNRDVGPYYGDKAVRGVHTGSWQCQGWDVRHTPEYVYLHPHLLCHTKLFVPQPRALPFRTQPFSGASQVQRGFLPRGVTNAEWQADTEQSCSWKPSCHSSEGQRGGDKWRDRSSMPCLDLGQGSRIRQHGWTLLASSQTIHAPQWTSTIARLSHLSLQPCGPEPGHTGVLEQGGEEMPGK